MERNLAGADIRTFKTNKHTVTECKTACMKNSDCVAYTFNKYTTQCWIKRAGHNRLSRDNNLISGLKSCYQGTRNTALLHKIRLKSFES